MIRLGFQSNELKGVTWLGEDKETLKNIYSSEVDGHKGGGRNTYNICSTKFNSNALINIDNSKIFNIECNDKKVNVLVELEGLFYVFCLQNYKWYQADGKGDTTELKKKELSKNIKYVDIQTLKCNKGSCSRRRGSETCLYCEKVSGCKFCEIDIVNTPYKIFYGDHFCEIEDEENKVY